MIERTQQAQRAGAHDAGLARDVQLAGGKIARAHVAAMLGEQHVDRLKLAVPRALSVCQIMTVSCFLETEDECSAMRALNCLRCHGIP